MAVKVHSNMKEATYATSKPNSHLQLGSHQHANHNFTH